MSQNDDLSIEAKARRKWELALGAIAALIAILSGLVATTFFVQRKQSDSLRGIELQQVINSQLEKNSEQIKMLQIELSNQIKSANPATAEMAKLSAEVNSLQDQVKALNEAIVESPEKALAVPLLRKDLENMKENSQKDLSTTQLEIERVYDQNRWFIGLVFSMAVGLLTLAVSNILQLKRM